MDAKSSAVLMGRIASPYGIKGWVKVVSFAEPLENILEYLPWQLRDRNNGAITRTVRELQGKKHGKGLVVGIPGVTDRDQAAELNGLEIVVPRSSLPQPSDDSYYWTDLEGLRVETAAGNVLGRIDSLLEAGAADVMVVCGEGDSKFRQLIPFIRGEVVLKVDLDDGFVVVNWEQDKSSVTDED